MVDSEIMVEIGDERCLILDGNGIKIIRRRGFFYEKTKVIAKNADQCRALARGLNEMAYRWEILNGGQDG